MNDVSVTPRSVLAISGSLRRDSWNRRLLVAASAIAPAHLRVELYDELAALPMFNEDDEDAAFLAGPVARLRARIAAADALLIATPEYNHSIPGVLKNALDWMSRPGARDVLVGKPVAVIGASSGRWGTRLAQAALRQVLNATEAVVPSSVAFYLGEAASAFDASGALTSPSNAAALGAVLHELDRLVVFVLAPAA